MLPSEEHNPSLQGFSTLREARPRRLGVNQNAVSNASLSFASYEVSCPQRTVSRFCPPSPLSRFVGLAFKLTVPPASQGFYRRRRSHSLSRLTRPP